MIHEPHQKSLRRTSAVAHLSAQESRLWTGLHPEAHLPGRLCPAGCPATNAMLSPTQGLSTTDAPGLHTLSVLSSPPARTRPLPLS